MVLAEAFRSSRNISVACLARTLNISLPTLYKNMNAYNISKSYSNISTLDLDALVREYKEAHPSSGSCFVHAFLRSSNLQVQQQRVLDSMKSVDSLGICLRKGKTVARRVYHSPRPNFLWHQDGHHKLGPWGIVIHGIIDGFDRTVSSKHLILATPARVLRRALFTLHVSSGMKCCNIWY